MGQAAVKRIWHSLRTRNRLKGLLTTAAIYENDQKGLEEWIGIRDSRSCFKKSDLITNFIGLQFGINSLQIRHSRLPIAVEARRLSMYMHEMVLGQSPNEVSHEFGFKSNTYYNKVRRDITESRDECAEFDSFVVDLFNALSDMVEKIQ